MGCALPAGGAVLAAQPSVQGEVCSHLGHLGWQGHPWGVGFGITLTLGLNDSIPVQTSFCPSPELFLQSQQSWGWWG